MKIGSDFWAVHVAAISRQATTVSAYAKRHGISASTLYYWQRKLAEVVEPVASTRVGSKFMELRVTERSNEPFSNACVLIMPLGLRLEMATLPTPEWLAAYGRSVQGAN